MGVWIETFWRRVLCSDMLVTPFVGVWIETSTSSGEGTERMVTPFVGVWIETLTSDLFFAPNSHTLRGCVD